MGSPGRAFFHSTKSKGERFSSPGSTRAPGAQRVEALAGQEAVAVDLVHREVDAVGGLVGDAGVHEGGDQLDHVSDEGGGVGGLGGPLHPEGIDGVPPHRLVLRGDLGLAPALLRGPVDDVVVDVGDVRHETDLETLELEEAPQHVEDEGHAAVAEVRHVVDGEATDVDRHAAFLP